MTTASGEAEATLQRLTLVRAICNGRSQTPAIEPVRCLLLTSSSSDDRSDVKNYCFAKRDERNELAEDTTIMMLLELIGHQLAAFPMYLLINKLRTPENDGGTAVEAQPVLH